MAETSTPAPTPEAVSKAPDEDTTVRRFSRWAIVQHGLVIVLFAVLLVTGLPQKWPYLDVSQRTIELMGGIFVTRWLHRVAGIVFALFTLAHLAVAVYGITTRRTQPSMLLTKKDFRDTIQNLQYYFGRRPEPPAFGRYDYRQKFEYWGLVFGGAIMVLTGFILYYPILFSRLLPAELIPAAKVMHSNEALLALLIILVWHMYGAHFNPDVFPFDPSIFTGKISLERLEHEHPLEYEELMAGRSRDRIEEEVRRESGRESKDGGG
ncbi:MAG: cytochrome b/b6 domain-containing protein [Thermoanaerobaculia bacterium]|nr:cytochrome b/b6 domain-containing protein [Thermoanaerobaculia bacterium]